MGIMKWTEIETSPENGLAFCLDGVGVLLVQIPHAGTWHYRYKGGEYRLSNSMDEAGAKAHVEETVARLGGRRCPG